MSPGTESLIRYATRAAALLAPGAGILLLVFELQRTELRVPWVAGAAALIAVGPLFWILARAHLTVLGATAGLLLGAALTVLGALGHGSGAGFDLGLGICLAGVAVWTLVGHFRGEQERRELERRRGKGPGPT